MSYKKDFLNGVISSIPVVVGYAAIGIPFGILAIKMGIPFWATVAFSIIVYAGSAQYVALQMLATGGALFPIVFATWILNLRHALMSVSLGSVLPTCRVPFLILFSHTITDESYGVNIGKIKEDEFLSSWNAMGTNLTSYAAWIGATVVGAIAGQMIDVDFKYLAGALPIMFVALMTTQIHERKHILLALGSAVLTIGLMQIVSGKWPFF